jgi:hypothetical protein
MLLVRDVFRAKPGMAKELVKKFKKVMPLMEAGGMSNTRIMTDIVSTYWTVVVESEIESLANFEKEVRSTNVSDEISEIMKDYMTLLDGGHREVYLIE